MAKKIRQCGGHKLRSCRDGVKLRRAKALPRRTSFLRDWYEDVRVPIEEGDTPIVEMVEIISDYFFSAFAISLAALAPDPPVSPVPGCVPLPHKYRRSIGVW
jgi:hypothetical protein